MGSRRRLESGIWPGRVCFGGGVGIGVEAGNLLALAMMQIAAGVVVVLVIPEGWPLRWNLLSRRG